MLEKEKSPQILQCTSKKTMKWMYLLYWLFLWCSGEFWDKSLAEKLTQEQVLEELGVKIETKGKKEGQKNYISRFPSLGIPRLELENPRWNTYVGHWNSDVGIPMSNLGIPTWVFSFLPRFLPNLMIFII